MSNQNRPDDRAEQVDVEQLIDAGAHRHDVAVEVEDAPVAARDRTGNEQSQVGRGAVPIGMSTALERVAGRQLNQFESGAEQPRWQHEVILREYADVEGSVGVQQRDLFGHEERVGRVVRVARHDHGSVVRHALSDVMLRHALAVREAARLTGLTDTS